MTKTATFHDLEGASVYITGGGSGIGADLTDGFLAQGAKVAFIGRSDASEFVAEMNDKHGRAPLFTQGDITDTEGLKRSVAAAAAAHGPIDVLVSNAANDKRHDWLSLSPEEWDSLLAVNLKAYFFAAQTVAPEMKKRGSGSIINFSSISYMMGNKGYPAYTAANGGITAMTRSLARELGPDGVRVNALAPGWVLTEKQLDKWATPEGLAAHLERQCLKSHLAPQDIVDAVLFLASNTSRMMTGQCMVVDGGVVTTGKRRNEQHTHGRLDCSGLGHIQSAGSCDAGRIGLGVCAVRRWYGEIDPRRFRACALGADQRLARRGYPARRCLWYGRLQTGLDRSILPCGTRRAPCG